MNYKALYKFILKACCQFSVAFWLADWQMQNRNLLHHYLTTKVWFSHISMLLKQFLTCLLDAPGTKTVTPSPYIV